MLILVEGCAGAVADAPQPESFPYGFGLCLMDPKDPVCARSAYRTVRHFLVLISMNTFTPGSTTPPGMPSVSARLILLSQLATRSLLEPERALTDLPRLGLLREAERIDLPSHLTDSGMAYSELGACDLFEDATPSLHAVQRALSDIAQVENVLGASWLQPLNTLPETGKVESFLLLAQVEHERCAQTLVISRRYGDPLLLMRSAFLHGYTESELRAECDKIAQDDASWVLRASPV